MLGETDAVDVGEDVRVVLAVSVAEVLGVDETLVDGDRESVLDAVDDRVLVTDAESVVEAVVLGVVR